MAAAAATYRFRNLVIPLAVFLFSGILAIVQQEFYWILLPFAFVLFQPLFTYVTTHATVFFWLLLITIPLSAEIQISPSLGLDFPDEPLLIILTGLVLVKIIQQPSWFPQAIKTHPLFFLLIGYMAWLVVTCYYSLEPLLSLKYLLAKTWYIIPMVILPMVILDSKERIGKMALCLLIPMLVGVVQSLIRHAFYGFSFESIKHIWSPFFRNHVNYSAILVCLIPVAWCCWKLTPAQQPVRKWIFIAILLLLTGLLFAYSRGAWVALGAGIGTVLLIQKKWLKQAIVISVATIIVSVSWLITDKHFMQFIPDHDKTYFHTNFGEHMFATVHGKDISGAERLYRWVAGARMIAEKPVTGFGPNTFYLHYRPYSVSGFRTWVSDNPEHSTVHNYFLLVALEQGIPGLILFSLLYIAMLLAAQRLYHSFQSRFYRYVSLVTGMVLVMTIVVNFLSDMIETDKTGGLFWLCLGMIFLLDKQQREEKQLLASVVNDQIA